MSEKTTKVRLADGEMARLLRQSPYGEPIRMRLGTPYADLTDAQVQALEAMRQAKQDEKDRVGDPR